VRRARTGHGERPRETPNRAGPMKLNELLDAYRATSTADQSQAVSAVFAHEARLLRAAMLRGTGPGNGGLAPDVVLPDSPDGRMRLSDLLRRGPLVLKFYRGRWCPFCTLELRAYQRALPEIEALGAKLLAVSPQNEHEVALNRERDRLDFPMVTDADNAIASRFGITYEVEPALRDIYRAAGIDFTRTNDASSWTLPLPATYVIDVDRRIAWSHVDPDYRRRAEPADVLHQLRLLRPR
jgi:peroxiredoxin